eukprot:14392767-Ditylum_brightwellii.AAC.1
MELKNCFNESQQDPLKATKMNYSDGDDNLAGSGEVSICGTEQRKLGDCVLKNSLQLEKRINRSNQSAQS